MGSLSQFCKELIDDDSIRRDGREGYANERVKARVVQLNDSQLKGMRDHLQRECRAQVDSFEIARGATKEVLEVVDLEYRTREQRRLEDERAATKVQRAQEKKRQLQADREGELARIRIIRVHHATEQAVEHVRALDLQRRTLERQELLKKLEIAKDARRLYYKAAVVVLGVGFLATLVTEFISTTVANLMLAVFVLIAMGLAFAGYQRVARIQPLGVTGARVARARARCSSRARNDRWSPLPRHRAQSATSKGPSTRTATATSSNKTARISSRGESSGTWLAKRARSGG